MTDEIFGRRLGVGVLRRLLLFTLAAWLCFAPCCARAAEGDKLIARWGYDGFDDTIQAICALGDWGPVEHPDSVTLMPYALSEGAEVPIFEEAITILFNVRETP